MNKEMVIRNEKVIELTKREQQCLQLSAKDMTCEEIAKKLYLSIHTVQRYRKRVLKKLNCRSLHGALYLAVRVGLIE